MVPWHPLGSIPAERRRSLFWMLLGATALCSVVLAAIDGPLRTDAAPHGIVSFELAGSASEARTIVASWDPTARLYAAFQLGFDFLYLTLYSTTLALACLWAGGRLRPRRPGLAGLGAWLAWGQWLAAGLDATENVALWTVLGGALAFPWPELAWWCAVPKFALILAGLLYAAVGWVGARRELRE